MTRDSRLYERAKKRFLDSMNIVTILRKLRDVHNFRRLFLTTKQNLLLKFSASNMIRSSSEEEPVN
jgi:hypothetical protein